MNFFHKFISFNLIQPYDNLFKKRVKIIMIQLI